MDAFLSLREFLLLEDKYDRSKFKRLMINGHYKSRFFVELYDKAKKSWEKYGDDGPPVGSKVMTFFGGHGSSGPAVRILGKEYSYGEFNYFQLIRKERDYFDSKNDIERVSLADKWCWWACFEVIED